VGDGHGLVGVRNDVGLKIVYKGVQCRALAAHLAAHHDVAGVVTFEQGTDAQRFAGDGHHAGNAARVMQEHQVVNHEAAAGVRDEVVHLLHGGLEGLTRVAHLQGLNNRQTLAKRGVLGVHKGNFAVGVFLPQLVRSHAGVIVCAADAGGHADVQDVLAFFDYFFKAVEKFRHVYKRGRHLHIYAHGVEKGLALYV